MRVLRVLLIVLLSVPFTVQALTIDDFNGVQVTSANPFDSSTSTGSDPTILGGTRTLFIEALSGPAALEARLVTAAGILSHSQETLVTAKSKATWDGTAPASLTPNGLGGIDFTQDGATAIRLEALSFDLPNGQTAGIKVTVYDSTDPTGNKRSSASVTLTQQVTSLTLIDLPFASFVASGPGGSADFKKIGAVVLEIDGSNSSIDLSLEWIGTNGKCRRLPDTFGKVIDQCGVCGGDNSSCADCQGVPNGPAVKGSSCLNQQLGVCSTAKWSQNCVCTRLTDPSPEICDGIDNNCDGSTDESFPLLGSSCGIGAAPCSVSGTYVCDGNGGMLCNATLQQAQVTQCESSKGCDGVPNSGLTIDVCNVCGGNNTSCIDCNGKPFGTAKLDRCNVCDGDGTSCLGCSQSIMNSIQATMDGLAKRQERVVKWVLERIGRYKIKDNTKKFIATTKKRANKLQVSNWILSWTLPSTIEQCTNTVLCSAKSHAFVLDTYRKQAAELRQLALESLRVLKKAAKKSDAWQVQRQKEADKLYKSAIDLANAYPPAQSVCDK